jgi:hypothetical protein
MRSKRHDNLSVLAINGGPYDQAFDAPGLSDAHLARFAELLAVRAVHLDPLDLSRAGARICGGGRGEDDCRYGQCGYAHDWSSVLNLSGQPATVAGRS